MPLVPLRLAKPSADTWLPPTRSLSTATLAYLHEIQPGAKNRTCVARGTQSTVLLCWRLQLYRYTCSQRYQNAGETTGRNITHPRYYHIIPHLTVSYLGPGSNYYVLVRQGVSYCNFSIKLCSHVFIFIRTSSLKLSKVPNS